MLVLINVSVSCGWGLRVGWACVLPESCWGKQRSAEVSKTSFGGEHPALPVEKCCFTGTRAHYGSAPVG